PLQVRQQQFGNAVVQAGNHRCQQHANESDGEATVECWCRRSVLDQGVTRYARSPRLRHYKASAGLVGELADSAGQPPPSARNSATTDSADAVAQRLNSAWPASNERCATRTD